MSYLEQFQDLLYKRDLDKIAYIWDEYSKQDPLNPKELIEVLELFKASKFNQALGKMIEKGVRCWERVVEESFKFDVCRLVIDLQLSNSEYMADLALLTLEEKYAKDPEFQEKLRIIGLREKVHFRGAVSFYQLLTHVAKGKFVYHTGGWGTGEVVDVSKLREELAVEFENVAGIKHLAFSSAFNHLIPLPDDHFLSKRFGNPDLLEEEARKNPTKVICMLLKDLGPKSAQDIREELSELVIPEEDWSKWWQTARAKIKRADQIESPKDLRGEFAFRTHILTPDQRFFKATNQEMSPLEFIHLLHSFYKDFAPSFKNEEFKQSVYAKIEEVLQKELSVEQKLQIFFLMQDIYQEKKEEIETLVKTFSGLEILSKIKILSLKKRLLMVIRKVQPNWIEGFLDILFLDEPTQIKDYALFELMKADRQDLVEEKVEEILEFGFKWPRVFWWYFQKVIAKHKLPFCDVRGKIRFFEGFLDLFSRLESDSEQKELLKKMYGLLIQNRYKLVREIFEIGSLEEVKEFLLLMSKCYIFTDQDQKIFKSLAEVVYPEIGDGKMREAFEDHVIWTTKEGYEKMQMRIKHIGTVETVKNAKEVEEARALGDLKENSEYKFALEKRARLQSELKLLSTQINKARILTREDVTRDQISVGSVVTLEGKDGKTQNFTILGPWEADPDQNIVSFQSRFATEMMGKEIGDKISFREEEYVVKRFRNYFE
ncbi:MAG: Transcription elongation factor GreA [Chlamydiae bacterium]|nr:Transcription elongation factor GreA [Chlamydiota bacterium]